MKPQTFQGSFKIGEITRAVSEQAAYFEELYEHLLLLMHLPTEGPDGFKYITAAEIVDQAIRRHKYPIMNNVFTHEELKKWRN